MVQLIIRRIGMMILIMLVVALLLFLINEGDPRLIARSILGPYAQDQQLDAWVIENGYDRSVIVRYFEWIGRIFSGDLGDSVIYKRPVSEIFWDRLGNTGILAGITFVIMVLIALTLGVLAGMKEGSLQDRDDLGLLDHHHLDPRVRQRGLPGRDLRLLARLAARHLVDVDRVRPAANDPACTCADAIWLRLHRAHDPRVDGRGDDHALHTNGGAEGPALSAHYPEARAEERPDCGPSP